MGAFMFFAGGFQVANIGVVVFFELVHAPVERVDRRGIFFGVEGKDQVGGDFKGAVVAKELGEGLGVGALAVRVHFYGGGVTQAVFLADQGIQAKATVFDQAFAHYNTLEEKQRPWRVLWYRVDAYQTYFENERYQSVIDLARATLSMLNKRGLEESHYWRGMAFEALGEFDKARQDYEIALQLRPTYRDALESLYKLK